MVPSGAIAGAMLRPGRCCPHAYMAGVEVGLGGHGGLCPGTIMPSAATNWGSKLMKQFVGGVAGALRATNLTLGTVAPLLALASQPSSRKSPPGAGETAA